MAGHYYTLVTYAQSIARVGFWTSFTTNPNLLLEHFFHLRGIPASKMDLENGDRAYRVPDSWIHRLDLDQTEQRYVRVATGFFYFTPDDPTLGKATKHDTWLPLGP